MERTLVPSTSVIVGFRYRGEATQGSGVATVLPQAAVTGLLTRARRMRTSRGGGIVLANLTEGEADRFFTKPVHHLFESTRPLQEWAPDQVVEETRQVMLAAKDDESRVAAMERFLATLLRPRPRDRAVAAAVAAIRETHGAIRIGELARSLDLSSDRLEKRFRQRVGASPKHFAGIVRVKRAVEDYRQGDNLARLAANAGFSDLAHFSRQMRSTMGKPPGRFFRSGNYC